MRGMTHRRSEGYRGAASLKGGAGAATVDRDAPNRQR